MEQLQQLPLFLRRIMSACFIIFQINNFISLAYLFKQDEHYNHIKILFTILMLMYPCLFSYFKTSQSNWSIVVFCLKWNFMCYIPTVKDSISQEKQNQLISSLIYFLKTALIYIHSLYSIVIYVKYEDGIILSLLIGSQFGFLTSTMMYELKQNYAQNHEACLRQIFTKFFFTNLLTGYGSLCSEVWSFYYIMILSILLGIAISQLKNLQSIFKFSYDHDVINFNYINASVIVFIFLSFTGINFGFLKRSLNIITGTQQEYCNFNSGLQSIILTIMIIFDFLLSDFSKNYIVRSILLSYLLIFSYNFYHILKNIYNFIRYGPFQRKILIDCSEISKLSNEELYQQYFRFKPMQYLINVLIKKSNVESFRKIASILLKEKNRKITFQMDYENLTHRLSYTMNSIQHSNLIQIYLDEKVYGSIIIEEIIKNKYYNFLFQISFFHDITSKKQSSLLNVVLNNYQIIPNIILPPPPKQQQFHVIFIVKQSIYEIIAFNKTIQQEMTFSQQQIIFDLYECF